MAETLSEIFERMLQKQQILVDKYHALEEKNKELSNGRIELENRIRKQKSEIERLQIENQYLKIARTIAPDQATLEKSRELVSKLVRDVEKCRQLQKKLSEATGLSCRIGIGSILPPEKMAESYRDAEKALETGKGSVAHCRDLPVFCEYEPDYPLHLENRLFDCIKAGKAQEAKEAARNYFDWMEETQKDYEPNIRLKTLEFVLFMEYVAYKSGGLLYRFRDRGEYLELAEKEELGKVRSWFVQKAEAAAAAAASCGAVVVVQATGPDRLYPSQCRDLFHQIADSGLVVSPFVPCTGFSPEKAS